MKKAISVLSVFLIVVFVFVSCSHSASVSNDDSSNNEGSDDVYICTGNYAKRYHSSSSCSGLDNCKGEIEEMSLSDAEDMGRTECSRCY